MKRIYNLCIITCLRKLSCLFFFLLESMCWLKVLQALAAIATIAKINIKYYLSYFYVRNLKKKIKQKFGFDCDSSDPRKQGILTLPESWIKECPRPITTEESFDSLGFCGVRSDGTVLIARIVRKISRSADVVLYLRMSNGDEYQLPNHPDTHILNTNGRSFSAAGLTFEVLEPLRCWRVIFNGYLRKGIRSNWDESEEGVTQIRFNFIWHPIHCYMGFPEDFNIASMAQLLASRKWFSEFMSPFELFKQDWHEQFGQLHGIVTIDGQDTEMLFRGLKTRAHGITVKNSFYFSFQGVLQMGCTFHLFVISNDNMQKFIYGYFCTADSMKIIPIPNCKLNVDTLINERSISENLVVQFTVEGKTYTIRTNRAEMNNSGMSVHLGKTWNEELTFYNVKFLMNDLAGEGIIEIGFSNENQLICPMAFRKSTFPLEDLIHLKTTKKLVVAFLDEECKSSQIVGGKGMSLALLSSLDDSSNTFNVPNGFCLTKTAFDLHLHNNPTLANAIDSLIYIATNKRDFLKMECSKLFELILSSKLSEEIKTSIIQLLKNIFGDHCFNIKFAVRSSAIGEDGEELSAAGQNDTILGVKGIDNICSAVIRCWASQFAFRSVEYKRQNGQLINAGMGVVIQEMVNAEIAGVLFSRDPLDGSLSKMIITSNFGLGESVVSATADPDYIKLRRSWNDKLFPTQDNIVGTKKSMITMNDDAGTVELKVDPEKSLKLTVDEELSLRLGNIALYLEKCFGSARDIEWAVNNQIIYLLQSRPMTGSSNMTDFEIIHEFDTSMKTDREHYTTANLGEVMPGAQTPVTTTSVYRSQLVSFQKEMTWRVTCHRFDPTVSEMFAIFYGHMMQERIQTKALNLEKTKSSMTKAMEIGIYGRILDETEIVQIALERFSNPPLLSKLILAKYAFKGIFNSKNIIKQMTKKFQDYDYPSLSGKTLKEVFDLIGNRLVDVQIALYAHFSTSVTSTIWNLMTLNTLSVGSGDYGLDQYSDFALIVGSCNGAESGDVPFSLKELAISVASEIAPSEFLKMNPMEALEWLKNENRETGHKYKSFIKRHGHRGLKELDISCVTWEIDPYQIVAVLQSMLKSPTSYKDSQETSIDDVINKLKTPLSSTKKKLLKWAMVKCRKGICNRENTKTLYVKVYDGVRVGLRHLAAMMVNEGLIPEVDLIFFFTFDEIDRFIETRSPLLIQRAKQRQKFHPYMNNLQFDEMIVGFPIPIDMNANVILPDNAEQIKGYPVSHGKIEGKARVLTSFQEVSTIQPGEILITNATDIGWSPYFPMLGGVVTELGGLISHGAVVAREFGLPCVVGAQNATRFFKTGDKILLDATKGTITKLSFNTDN